MRPTESDAMVPLHEDLPAGDPHREHWVVPVPGLNSAHPDGVLHAVAHRDGTVSLHLTHGSCHTAIKLDISRAIQLCTGIREAATAAQRAAGQTGVHRFPPLPDDPAKEINRRVGLRIQRLRHNRRASLRVVSGLAGMSIATLHRIENGRRALHLNEVAALADALRVTPATLLTLSDPARPEVG